MVRGFMDVCAGIVPFAGCVLQLASDSIVDHRWLC